MNNLRNSILIILVAVFFNACEEKEKPVVLNWNELEDQLIESHKYNTNRENELIGEYIESKGWDKMNESKTGLRYWIYEDTEGEAIKSLDWAQINYTVRLLSDSVVYDSGENPKKIHVDMDDYPSGIHEGLKMMSPGDKAWFILPSRLAYGLTGDQVSIPMNSCIVVDLHLVN